MAENKKGSGYWECTLKKGPSKGETEVYHKSTADTLEKKGWLKKEKELDKYVPRHVKK